MKLVNELRELSNLFISNINYYKNDSFYNEDTCRLEFIDHFLECFNWDVSNSKHVRPELKEVIVEKYSDRSNRPDYTLQNRGYTKLFVEAKKPSVDISKDKDSAFQIRRYGWNANLYMSVLTNFEYTSFYLTINAPNNEDNTDTFLIKRFHCSEYADKYDEISALLNKENVYSDEYLETISKYISFEKDARTTIDDIFLSDLNKWRIGLSNELIKKDKNKYSNIRFLNHCVQRFINEIVFLRICEDRNIEKYHLLANNTDDKTNSKLIKLFKEADKKYNSGLFKNNEIVFDLNNEIIKDIVEQLYYPRSPYQFNIIEPNMLGSIYEIFLTESIVLSKNNKVVLSNKADYKDRSVVKTPENIVRFISFDALDGLLSEKKYSEVFDLKIADIACGSGIFLEKVFDIICKYLVDWCLKNNKNDFIEETNNGTFKLIYKEKCKLMKNVIYGIDIDSDAVEVAIFSLLIKLIENETEESVSQIRPILPDLTTNIICGNSLIESCEIDVDEIGLSDSLEINPINTETLNNIGSFDLIIGNPPYMKTSDLKQLRPNAEFNFYKEKYISSYKQFDKYFLFTEKGYKMLKQNGVLSYIIPNKFLKIGSGLKLRDFLLKDKCNIKIVNFGSNQLFSDRTIYSCILRLNKDTSSNNCFAYSDARGIGDNELIDETNNNKCQKETLNASSWERVYSSYSTNDRMIKLNEIATSFNGIQTSANSVYVFNENNIIEKKDDYYLIKLNDNDYKILSKYIRKFYKPTKQKEKNRDTFEEPETDKYLLYPYENGEVVKPSKLKKINKDLFIYFKDTFEIIKPKCIGGSRDVQNYDGHSWYQYGRTQALTSFINQEKIIVKNMFLEPMFAIDRNDFFLSSGGTAGFSAIKISDERYCLEYVQAWLNCSKTVERIRELGSPFEGGFTSIGTSVLDKLDIYSIDFDDEIELNKYNTIVNAAKEINSLYRIYNLEKLSNRKKIIKEQIDNKKIYLDNFVSKLYEV